jgi:hypothetical protein
MVPRGRCIKGYSLILVSVEIGSGPYQLFIEKRWVTRKYTDRRKTGAAMIAVKRKWTLFAILLIVPIGFYTKFYTGPAAVWVNNSLGGVLYVVFWSLMLYLARPSLPPFKNGGMVLLGTCIIEILQLWHPHFLELVRRNFFGASVFGTTFVWMDFAYYGAGCLVAAAVLKLLRRLERR